MKVKLYILTIFFVLLQQCYAPPVSKHKEEETQTQDGLDFIEYNRYLKEVVNVLESDPDFRKKLENATEEDIRSGKIARELEFVSHSVRTTLDEIKRRELERLLELKEKQQELIDNEIIDDPRHHHLDHDNQHTFEVEDLKRLILKTTEDLDEVDRKRRDEFKHYEMQKEFDKQDKLNHTTGEEHEKLEKQYKEIDEKHKKHEKLHEPGHKAQLEEVWEEQDHMQQEFDPKTFFMLHDLDSNGLWDQDEVKALFVKELDKLYSAGLPEDDMRERAEEMERMRESVFKEVDTNRDGLIDFQEFISQTKRQDFQQDHGWQGIDENRPYTDEELAEYIRQQQMMHPPPPGYPGGHPPPGAYHPNQVPPHGGYQGPPQGYHPNQVPQGYHPNQIPQGQAQYHPGQANHGQVHPQQIPHQVVPQGNHPSLNTNEIYQNQQQQHGNQPQYNQLNVQNPQINQQQQNYQQQNVPNQANQQQNVPNQANQQQNVQNQANQQQNVPNQANNQQANNQVPNVQQNNPGNAQQQAPSSGH